MPDPICARAARALALAAFSVLAAAMLGQVPWAFAIASLALTLGAVQAASRVPWVRVLCFNLAFLLLLVAALEFWAFDTRRRGLGQAQQLRGESIYSSVADQQLGYSLTPSQTRVATKWFGEELVYETRHTHDANGYRIAPPRAEVAASELPAVLFFGGSFTYGEGVNDDETAAFVTGALLGEQYATYNFGVNGYGPQQMLRSAEQGIADAVIRDRPLFVIYQGIADHVSRAAGRAQWLAAGPQYELRSEHLRLVKEPIGDRDDSRLRRLLETANIVQLMRARDWFVPQNDLDVYLEIVDRSRIAFESSYPNAEFHILLWDQAGNRLTNAMLEGFRARDLRAHLVSEILPGYRSIADPASPHRVSQYDPHPGPEAQRSLAEFIVDQIIRPEKAVP